VLAEEFGDYSIAAAAIQTKLFDRDIIFDGDSERA
jgi:hypothetical protein